MHYITTANREMILKDEDGDELCFATVDAAIVKARELTEPGGIFYVIDSRPSRAQPAKVRVRARQGRATWVTKCKACGGSGVMAGLGGMYGPPPCGRCEDGYIDDLDCAR